MNAKFDVYIAYEDPYVQPLILEALSVFPSASSNILESPLPEDLSPICRKCLHIMQFERLSHTALLFHPAIYIGNAYTQRAALIRKNQLAATVSSYLSKHPTSVLRTHTPTTVSFELDYAEFLDDALLEAYELHECWARNNGRPRAKREWWILKPALADRGQGIRLFSSEDELQAIFEEWESANPEESDKDEEEVVNEHEEEDSRPTTESKNMIPSTQYASNGNANSGLITSLLRHFVAQPYIAPLLLSQLGNRKFHIRTYVLAVGALKVYVYREMLALFAAEEYSPPGNERTEQHGEKDENGDENEDGDGIDMRRHLTNTCLQLEASDTYSQRLPDTVHRYWSLPSTLHSSTPSSPDPSWLHTAFSTICSVTSDIFSAAAAQPTGFQPLPNAFEIFGIDFLIDGNGEPWLLEVNAFPDFAQTGEELRAVVGGLWKGALGRVGVELLGVPARAEGVVGGKNEDEEREAKGKEMGKMDEWGFVRVLDLDMGRR